MTIPIIIICYNNYKYVRHTIEQLRRINKEYYKNIQIVNNNSTCVHTINFLKNLDINVIHNSTNNGPWITPTNNRHIYNSLPDKFILTDPDLKLNTNIPHNFIEILSELSDTYKTEKIGFALDIDDFEKMYKNTNYAHGKSIYEWELQLWNKKIQDPIYDLYNHTIDTTFCLVNKNYIHTDYHIRIAGDFTAKHLPWYRENEIYTTYEQYINSTNTTRISTTSRIILQYIEEVFLKIYKHNELFLIKNDMDNQNLSFWKNIYSTWEDDTFNIFDTYLSQDKIFIDVGGWIGTTAMYGSRRSKHVYSVEADTKSFDDMLVNLQTNCCNNYTLINKCIFNIDNRTIKFGKNQFLPNSKLNDSTSQIYSDDIQSGDFYLAETITIGSIIRIYQINPSDISLIKVDIEGGEENILDDLYDIHVTYNIPLYISFHYTWWKDRNLDRFLFLSSTTKKKIQAKPFMSILFNSGENV